MRSPVRAVVAVGIIALVVAFAVPTAIDSFLSLESTGFAGIAEGLAGLVIVSVVIVIGVILKEVVM